ncbi:hypothetical protein ACFQI7_05550 [Paenibacillus allorhizosphaerae]
MHHVAPVAISLTTDNLASRCSSCNLIDN